MQLTKRGMRWISRGPMGWGAAAVLVMWLSGCAQVPVDPAQAGDNRGAPTVAAAAPAQESDERRRARIRMELAEAYFSQGQVNIAQDEIRQALSIDANLPQAHHLQALIHDTLGEEAPAQASFERALRLTPLDGDLLHNYGWFHCKRGRFEPAAALFTRALEAPSYRDVAKTWFVRGVCEGRAGQDEAAERSLYRAHQLDPGNPATAYTLADLLMRRGEYERARFYIRRVNGNPDFVNAQSLWLHARIEHRAGNVALANDLGRQLRGRFPRSREAAAFDRGAFHE